MPSEKIFIVGAGSVGAYFGARLSRVASVSCLVRSRASADRLSGGVELVGVESGHYTPAFLSWGEVDEFPAGSVLLVTTKLTQFQEVSGEISKRLKHPASTQIVLCQNGLQVLEEAQKFLPPEAQLARMLCWFGTRLEPPARIVVAGGNTVEVAGGAPDFMEGLERVFRDAGFEYHRRSDVAEIEWKKALWNLAVNAMCGIAEAPNGAAVENPHLNALANQLIDEALVVAGKLGVSLSPDARAKVFDACARTAINYNSTVQDLRAGRRTEIPWLNGAVVALGEKLGVPVPTHRFVSEMVYFLEGREVR